MIILSYTDMASGTVMLARSHRSDADHAEVEYLLI